MRHRLILLLAALACALPCAAALADDTVDFTYGGRLTAKDGKPFDGPVALQLAFYRQASGGIALLTVTDGLGKVTLQEGIFQVTLALSAADYAQVFTAVSVPTFVEVTDLTHAPDKPFPRQQINTVPYAGRVPVDGRTVDFGADGRLTVLPHSDPAAGEFLTKDSSGNFTWAAPPTSATALQGHEVSSTVVPAAGQVLTFDGTKWAAGTVTFSGATASTLTNGSATLTLPTATGTLATLSGTETLANKVLSSPTITGGTMGAAPGAVATPSYSFSGDSDTGLWSSDANTVNVSTGGSERLRVDANGKVGIGTSIPATALEISANAGYPSGAAELRITNSARTFLTTDMSTDATGLHIDTNNGFPGGPLVVGSGVFNITMTPSASYGGTISEGYGSLSLLSDSGSGIFIGGSTGNSGNVGIGTTTPVGPLEVTSSGNASIYSTGYGGTTNWGSFVGRTARGDAGSPMPLLADDYMMNFGGRGYYGAFPSASQAAINFKAGEDFSATHQGAYIAFDTTPLGGTSRTERVRIDPAGKVGIGTTTPGAKLEVDGTVKIVDGSQGTGKVLTSDANGLASWVTPAGAAGYNSNAGAPANSLYIDSAGKIGFSTAATGGGDVTMSQLTNGDTLLFAKRNTDTAPTGSFVDWQTAGGASLFKVAIDGTVTDTKSNLGTTSTDGLVLQNQSAAGAGAQQYSPRLHLSGSGWKTTATAGSQAVDWIQQVVPVQGTTAPKSYLDFSSSVNGGAYGNVLALTSGGNVGIGITNPTSALVVGSSSQFKVTSYGEVSTYNTVTDDQPTLSVTSELTSTAIGAESTASLVNSSVAVNTPTSLQFHHFNAASGEKTAAAIEASLNNVTGGSEAGWMRFGTYGAGALTERMRIDSSGNVGIGTTSSGSPLEVWSATVPTSRFVSTQALGAASGGLVQLVASAVPTAADQRLGQLNFSAMNGSSAVSAALVKAYSSEPWAIGSAIGAYLAFSTTASGTNSTLERVRIDPSGNVGIGTTSPGYALDVGAGDINLASGGIRFASGSPSLYLASGAVHVDSSNSIYLNAPNVGMPSPVASVALNINKGVFATSGGAAGVKIVPTLTAAANNDALNGLVINPTYADGSYTGVTHNALIVSSGNVGIGTTSPTAALSVISSGTTTPTLKLTGIAAQTANVLDVSIPGYSIMTIGGSGAINLSNLTMGSTTYLNSASVTYPAFVSSYKASIGALSVAAGLDVNLGISASGGAAIGVQGKQTLTATANDDTLTALNIAPTFADGGFSGVSHNGLIVASGNVGIGTTGPQTALDVNGQVRVAKNSSQPFACDVAHDGTLALTHVYTMCVCNGGSTSWVQTANGSSACSW